jgi:GNAT superfamily N-acetyltransferase
MRFDGSAPSPSHVASPYTVRAWRPGDEAGWVALLHESGAFGDWDLARLKQETRGLVPEAQFFACHEGQIVAATGVLDRPLGGQPGLEIAWVVRHPRHAGHELGLAVTTRALRAAAELRPPRPIYLYTDDHRLTAVAMYLKLGFVPDTRAHHSYAARWEAVLSALQSREQRPDGASPGV